MALKIPAFSVGGTPTPYTEIGSPTRELRDATAVAGRASVNAAAWAENVGETARVVGNDLFQFNERLKEQEAITAVQSARAEYHVRGAQASLEWENSIDGPTALDSPKSLKGNLETIRKELVDKAPSELAKQKIDQDLSTREADLVVHGERVARKKFMDYQSQVEDQTIVNFRKGAYLAGGSGDAAALQKTIDDATAGIMASGVAGIVRNKAEADMYAGTVSSSLVGDYLAGMLGNPKLAGKAIRDFEAGAYNDKLGFKELTKAANIVEVRKNQLIAEARRAQAEAKQRQREDAYDTMEYLKDQAASAAATGKVSGNTAGAIDKLRKMGGTFARKADDIESSITMGIQVNGVLQENVFLPFDQQRAKLASLQPKEGEENYAIKANAIDRGLRAIDSQEQAFRHDPAEFAMRRAANQVIQAGGDPTTDFTRTIRTSLEIQRQMGLGENDLRVVPTADAKRLASDFAAGDTDTKLRVMEQLRVFGPYTAKALHQLEIDQSALHAYAIMNTDSPQAKNNAGLFLEASSPKIKLTDEEDAAYAKDIMTKSETVRILQKQAAGLGAYGVQRNTYAQSLIGAMKRVSKTLGDPKEAVRIADSAYTAVDDNRLAVVLAPKSMSEKDALAGFGLLRAQISEADMTDVKAGLVARFGQAQGERMFMAKVRDIQTSGIWLNDGDGKYALFDPGTQKPVLLNGGRTLRITSEQLWQAARQARDNVTNITATAGMGLP